VAQRAHLTAEIPVQLIGELDAMIAIAQLDTSQITDPVHRLRVDLLEHRVTILRQVLAQDKTAEAELGNRSGGPEACTPLGHTTLGVAHTKHHP
jgi:hypothetical protein